VGGGEEGRAPGGASRNTARYYLEYARLE